MKDGRSWRTFGLDGVTKPSARRMIPGLVTLGMNLEMARAVYRERNQYTKNKTNPRDF